MFRPDLNFELVALKAAWPDRSTDDRPSPERIVDHIDEQGRVVWRLRTLDEVLELIEGSVRGETT